MVITRSGKDTSETSIWGQCIKNVDKYGYFDFPYQKWGCDEEYTARIPIYFHYIDNKNTVMLKKLTSMYDIDIEAWTDEEEKVGIEWDDWNKGCSPISYAARGGNWDMVKYLIELGADINSGVDEDGDNTLHYAVKENDVIMVRYLLDKGADYGYHDNSIFIADDGEIKDMLKSVLLIDDDYFREEY